MTYTDAQIEQLLKPINPKRVGQREGQSHVEAYEIAAHLTRLFGFPPAWRKEIVELACIHESSRPHPRDDSKLQWTVVYRCQMRLWVLDEIVGDDAATGDGINMPQPGAAHDFAVKTAVSQALKRCAKDLGDQFGLSLYRKGSTGQLVGRSLAYPPRNRAGEPMSERQDDVEAHAPAWEAEQDGRTADPETGEILEQEWTTTSPSAPTATAGSPSNAPAAGTPAPSMETGMPSTPGATTAQPSAQTDLGGQLPVASTPERIAEVRAEIDEHVMMISRGQISRIMGQAGRVWKGKTRIEIDKAAQAFCIAHVAERGLPKRVITSRSQLTHQEAEDIIGRLMDMAPEAES
jgi:hypothetical protein